MHRASQFGQRPLQIASRDALGQQLLRVHAVVGLGGVGSWLVEALAILGRIDEARELFERLVPPVQLDVRDDALAVAAHHDVAAVDIAAGTLITLGMVE